MEKDAVPKSLNIVAYGKSKKNRQIVQKNPLYDEVGIHDKACVDLLTSHGVYPLLEDDEEVDSIECVLQNASLSEAEYIRKVESGVKDYEPTRIVANTLLAY